MRDPLTAPRLRDFMKRLGEVATAETAIYLTGGATSVLLGWRETTLDVDLKFVPERDEFFRAIPRLKEELRINVELASPPDFIPPLPGWESRSPFIAREGRVSWHHFDPYSQALAKIERGHARDVGDVAQLIQRGLVDPRRLQEYFERIKPDLARYPAIDPGAFTRKVDEVVRHHLRP